METTTHDVVNVGDGYVCGGVGLRGTIISQGDCGNGR